MSRNVCSACAHCWPRSQALMAALLTTTVGVRLSICASAPPRPAPAATCAPAVALDEAYQHGVPRRPVRGPALTRPRRPPRGPAPRERGEAPRRGRGPSEPRRHGPKSLPAAAGSPARGTWQAPSTSHPGRASPRHENMVPVYFLVGDSLRGLF
ncbi:unnamed protein product [Prorocentrum cordatum]|uniref:Uncharacterized protein n=1 Tax=Prorocentrum cordatum TaxID=2364126 RepID=A0ABN9RTF5_9DINO|nr:unnamed protein product [Polarella glacialis]